MARRLVWAPGMVLTVSALMLVAPASEAKTSKSLIVTPKQGKRIQSSPVRVSIRAGYRTRSVRVSLNGRDVSGLFPRHRASKAGRRTVVLSANHGLHYGRNVLKVARRERSGATLYTRRITFTLTRKRPLVGAGNDRKVEVGRVLRLNGRASRRRGAPRARRGVALQPGTPAGLKMRWRFVRKPRGSRAKLSGYATGRQPQDRRLRALGTRKGVPARQPARPSFKPDKVGRYVVELVVRDGTVRSAADRATLTAAAATPLVPIDTQATVGGAKGIAVGYHPATKGGRAPIASRGERFFPLSSGNSLQLVVLDRDTLETAGSFAYPASGKGVKAAAAQVNQYGSGHLILLTAWASSVWGSVQVTFQTGPNTYEIEPPTEAITSSAGPAAM